MPLLDYLVKECNSYVSPLPGPAPIMLGGPMSVLGLETGVAVFWLVLRFFFGLPPDWEPLGTLKFCGMMGGYRLRSSAHISIRPLECIFFCFSSVLFYVSSFVGC